MSEEKKPIPMQWWYAGVTATMGGIAGLFGSIYAAEIVAWPLFSWLKCWPSAPPIVFLVALFAFGLLFGYGFRAQTREQDASAKTLNLSVSEAKTAFKEQLDKLEETIRTLPPDSFLEEFEDSFKEAFSITAEALACQDENELQELLSDAITVCLAAILELAVSYDPPADNTVYTISLMLMKPLPESEEERAQLRKELQMFEVTTDLATLDGYLETHPEFSLSWNLPDGEDKRLGSIKFPIPSENFRKDGDRSTVLPGAPTVWCSHDEMQYIPNVDAMVDSLSSSALRPSVQETARNYFKSHPKGRNVRSFISLPLVIPATEPAPVESTGAVPAAVEPTGAVPAAAEPTGAVPAAAGPVVAEPKVADLKFGVINLHSSSEGLLGTKRAQLYGPLTQPMRALLCLLWQRWTEKGYE